MTDPAEPDGQSINARLATLLERSQNTERFTSTLVQSLQTLTETINRLDRSQVQNNESLAARSEANRIAIVSLDAKIEHKEGTSIQRDAQQVTMIRDEERAREKGIEEERKAWGQALKERDERHDKDIAEIKADIKSMSDKLENSVFWNRIMAGAAAVLAIVAGAAITAGINHLFP